MKHAAVLETDCMFVAACNALLGYLVVESRCIIDIKEREGT